MSVTTSTTIKTARKRAPIGPSSVVVQRTLPGTRQSFGGPSTMITSRRSNVMRSSIAPVGDATRATSEAVQSVKGMRGKEKKDMCDLNGRLAELIENLRRLETTNKLLYEQIEQLKKMKGITGDRIKDEFEDEINELRMAYDTASKALSPLQADKLELEDKIETLLAEIEELKKNNASLFGQIEKLNHMLGEIEGENCALKRNADNAQTERDMYKKELNTVRDDNSRLRDDLNAARCKQIDAENEKENLAEELQFLRDCTDKEIEELRECLKQFQDMTPKMESMYKSGMKEVMTELQEHYANQVEDMKLEMERRYEDRILAMQQDLRRDNTDSGITKTENKHLKTENKDIKDRLRDLERENDRLNDLIAQLKQQKVRDDEEHDKELFALTEEMDILREQLNAITMEMDGLRDAKLSLELEIACYKKLLEGEENKMRRTLEDSVQMRSAGGENLASIIAGGPVSSGSQSTQQSS